MLGRTNWTPRLASPLLVARAEGAIFFLVSYNSYTVLKCVLNVEATLLEAQTAYFGSVSYRNRMSQITIYLKSIVSDQYLPEASVSNHYLPGRASVSNYYLPRHRVF